MYSDINGEYPQGRPTGRLIFLHRRCLDARSLVRPSV